MTILKVIFRNRKEVSKIVKNKNIIDSNWKLICYNKIDIITELSKCTIINNNALEKVIWQGLVIIKKCISKP